MADKVRMRYVNRGNAAAHGLEDEFDAATAAHGDCAGFGVDAAGATYAVPHGPKNAGVDLEQRVEVKLTAAQRRLVDTISEPVFPVRDDDTDDD